MSMRKEDVTVVIPTLNEENGIGQILCELKDVGYSNILVVDGHSTDGTARVAESNGGCVVFQHGKGKCGALETAIENVKTPYILVMDGDCTYNPKDIDAFLNYCEKYDQVIGVRANGRKNIPGLNRFGNWVITKTFNLLMGTKLSDVCSGMYLIKTDAARALDLHSTGFDVEVEIAAQTSTNGPITEIPIDYRKRVGRQKLSSWKHGLQIIRTVFGLARTYNPALLFSSVGILSIIPAAILLGWVMFEMFLYGIWFGEYAVIGTMLLVLATQGLTIATISLLVRRAEKRILRQIAGNSTK